MTPEQLGQLGQLLEMRKEASIPAHAASAIKNIWGAARSGSETAARALEGAGHPLIGGVARYTPHAGVVAGGKETYESEPVQRMLYRYKLWKARRAQRAAMGY